MPSADIPFLDAARRAFDYLEDEFGLRRVTAKTTNFSLTLTYRGRQVAVRVHFEPRDDAVWVTLHRVVGRRLPQYDEPDYDANSWDLGGILLLRAPLVTYELAYRWGYRPYVDLMARCIKQADALRCYATDFLRAEFRDLPRLERFWRVTMERQALRSVFQAHVSSVLQFLREGHAFKVTLSPGRAVEPWVRYDADKASVLITYHDYVGCISVLVLVGPGITDLRAAGVEPSVERIGRWSIESCLEAGGLPMEEPLAEVTLRRALDQLAHDLAMVDMDRWRGCGASAPEPETPEAPITLHSTVWPGCTAVLTVVPIRSQLPLGASGEVDNAPSVDNP